MRGHRIKSRNFSEEVFRGSASNYMNEINEKKGRRRNSKILRRIRKILSPRSDPSLNVGNDEFQEAPAVATPNSSNATESTVIEFDNDDIQKIIESDKDDDCASDVKSIDTYSILSQPEFREYYDELQGEEEDEHDDDNDEGDSDIIDSNIKQKWNALEKDFKARDRLFKIIIKGKSANFVRQLQQREHLVRKQRREKLLMEQLYNVKKNDKNDDFQIPKIPVEEDSAIPRTRLQKICDFLVYEMNSTIPAAICVTMHNIAHAAIYDIFNGVIKAIERDTEKLFESDVYYPVFYFCIFAIGTLMMRSTGDLFWFLGDQDYDCLKYDYHNRIRLQFWDAKVMYNVRLRDIFRFSLYVAGYYLCYGASLYVYGKLATIFDQRKILLRDLPSLLDEENGICRPEMDIPSWTMTCQEEIDLQEEEYVDLKQADLLYTWSVLSGNSYDNYWLDWVHRMDIYGPENVAVFSYKGELLYSFTVVVASITILWMFGFKFWRKF